MMLEWIPWNDTIYALAKHLGGEIKVGVQVEMGKSKWDKDGRVVLFGDMRAGSNIGKPDRRGYDFYSVYDEGCGCCASSEFAKGDIVVRYRIWPVNDGDGH